MGKQQHTDLFGEPVEEPATHISPKMEKYRDYFNTFTVEKLHDSRICLGFPFTKGKKDVLVSAVLSFFSSWEEGEQFQKWFESLPPYLSRAIEVATFMGYIDAELVEKTAGQPVSIGSRSYYSDYQLINPELRLGIFDLYHNYDRKLLTLNSLFRSLFVSYLPVPPLYFMSPCAEQESSGWSVVATLSESMPLLLKGIKQLLEDKSNHEKILRHGLNKTRIKELRRSSAFPSFPRGAETGVDPIDLIARFIMIDPEQSTYSQKSDVRDFVKGAVYAFFTIPPSGKVISRYLWIDSSFEFSVLCPQLRKRQGPRQNRFDFHPHSPSRTIFFQLLKLMAESRGWYNVDEAAESLRMQALTFSIFRNNDSAVDFFVKGEALDLPDGTIETKSWEKGFIPDVYLAHTLLTRPLLKGYCYLMASLGLLEIEEEEPEKLVIQNGTPSFVSPFEGLARVRVTPFGAWCLGVSDEKPELRPVHYEAIADRGLPLVTYRGQSLECKVFLELIGDLIGEDRYRVSEASFVRGCRNEEEIEHRIGEFRRLIAKEPAGHWGELFSRVRERARLFEREEPAILIQLPAEQALRRLFVEETKLSSLIFRAEGGRIVVPQKNYKKLRKALEEYGVIKA